MKKTFWIFAILLSLSSISHAETPSAEQLQSTFETRYQTFLAPNSQSKLPFDELSKPAWKAIQQAGKLNTVFQKQDVFYQGKSYVFTLYQSAEGKYYLDAKGGFWGMEELIYGPIAPELLQ